MQIEQAQPADYDQIAALLAAVGLDDTGLRGHLGHALVARDGGAIIGSAALEIYGDVALLRSVAVAPGGQRRQLGAALVAAAVAAARNAGVGALYLFTATAADFFAQHGFAAADPASVPAALRQSGQWRSGCAASGATMVRPLD